MANVLALLAFSGLISAQFLAVVFSYQYHRDMFAPHETKLERLTLVHRAA